MVSVQTWPSIIPLAPSSHASETLHPTYVRPVADVFRHSLHPPLLTIVHDNLIYTSETGTSANSERRSRSMHKGINCGICIVRLMPTKLMLNDPCPVKLGMIIMLCYDVLSPWKYHNKLYPTNNNLSSTLFLTIDTSSQVLCVYCIACIIYSRHWFSSAQSEQSQVPSHREHRAIHRSLAEQ